MFFAKICCGNDANDPDDNIACGVEAVVGGRRLDNADTVVEESPIGFP